MTTTSIAEEPPIITDDTGPAPPSWEFPEIAAVVVLVAVGLLALGGLATGLATVWQQRLPGFNRVLAGRAVGLGGGWANVPLAGVLLGVMGVCWWTQRRWKPRLDNPSQGIIAAIHIGRCGAFAIWTQAALFSPPLRL